METYSKWVTDEFKATGKMQSPNKLVNFLSEKLIIVDMFVRDALKWPGDARITKQIRKSSASSDFDYRIIDSIITTVRFFQPF